MYKMETERCPETVLQQDYLEEDLKEDKPGRSVFRREENEQNVSQRLENFERFLYHIYTIRYKRSATE
jgi:hypothetical protein